MKEYIRGRLEKAVSNYDNEFKSRSLMDFIQANVRSRADVFCVSLFQPYGSYTSYSIHCDRQPKLVPFHHYSDKSTPKSAWSICSLAVVH